MTGARLKQLTRADLKAMTSEEIVTAHEAGALDDLLGVGLYDDEEPLPEWESNFVIWDANTGKIDAFEGHKNEAEARAFIDEVDREFARLASSAAPVATVSPARQARQGQPRARGPRTRRKAASASSRTSNSSDPEPPLPRRCLGCGAHFESDDPRRLYCSEPCRNRDRQRRHKAKVTAGREEAVCPWCGDFCKRLNERTGFCRACTHALEVREAVAA